MISDVLSDAVHDIRRFLSDPVTHDTYSNPNLRAEIDAVVGSMDTLRQRLDQLDWPPEWCNRAETETEH